MRSFLTIFIFAFFTIQASSASAAPAVAKKVKLRALEHHFFLPPPESAISPEELGVGLTAGLRKFDRKEGALGPAFKNKTREIPTNKCRFQFVKIEDTFSLKANAAYLFVSGSIGTSEKRRHMIYRAYCTSKVVKLAFEAGAKPEGAAAVTPVAIHYGWSLDVVLSGSIDAFDAGAAAKIAQFGGSLETQKATYSLESKQTTRGLTPKVGGSIHLVSSSDDILKHYQQSTKPAPILVEYMLTKDIEANAIKWKEASGSPVAGEYKVEVEIEISRMKVVRGRSKNWDGFGAGGPDIRLSLRTLRRGKTAKIGQTLCKNSYVCRVKASIDVDGKTSLIIDAIEQDVSNNDPIGSVTIKNLLSDVKTVGTPSEILAETPHIKKLTVTLKPR